MRRSARKRTPRNTEPIDPSIRAYLPQELQTADEEVTDAAETLRLAEAIAGSVLDRRQRVAAAIRCLGYDPDQYIADARALRAPPP